MKKISAIILAIVIAFGWYVSLFGIGPVKPLKDQMKLGLDMVGGVSVLMEAETDLTGTELKQLMNQTQLVIENRVNEMGLSEPVVTIEGEKRIRVELPGADNADEAIKLIGQTAQLQFVTADGKIVLTGSNVKKASATSYQGNDATLMGTYVVNMEFDNTGATAFEDATKRIMEGQITPSMEGFGANQILIVLDDEVLSSPQVANVIPGGKCQITGNFGKDYATNLAALVRGGSLPVALHEVQAQDVGPSLGLEAARVSLVAGVIGVLLIMVLMVASYKLMGVTADIALLLYILMVFWAIIALKGVLTLPGIAGLILSVGMAVDANVIIFSRIKEEVVAGKSLRVAVDAGFKRAIATVMDSQITTIIAAIVLYQLGTGSVKGFALTLIIGILASLITAIVVTQLYLGIFAESKTLGKTRLFGIKEAK